MPYYVEGEGSGSVSVPIVLQTASITGAVFIGNMALEITASTLAEYGSGSLFPPVSAALNYWNNTLQRWVPVSGNMGSLYITSSADNPMWVSGVFTPSLDVVGGSAITMVRASPTGTLLIGENLGRKTLSVYNDTLQDLYVALGNTASLARFSAKVPPGGLYELPAMNAIYTGPVCGIWNAATPGSASVTEIMA